MQVIFLLESCLRNFPKWQKGFSQALCLDLGAEVAHKYVVVLWGRKYYIILYHTQILYHIIYKYVVVLWGRKSPTVYISLFVYICLYLFIFFYVWGRPQICGSAVGEEICYCLYLKIFEAFFLVLSSSPSSSSSSSSSSPSPSPPSYGSVCVPSLA